MATRREQLEVGLLASDKASAVIKDVASQVEALDGETADVTVTAEDRASADVRELMGRIDSLTDEDKQVILTAEASKLEREVKRATTLLGAVDGETFEATLDARNVAQTKLDAVQAELTAIDNRTADATVEVTDHATGDLSRIDSRLDEIDKGADAEINATVGPGLSGLFDDVGDLPVNVGAIGPAIMPMLNKGGAIGLLGVAMAGIATSAANTATDVGTIQALTGATPEQGSGLLAVWRQTGAEVGDLLDVLAQVNGVMATSPDIAAELGIAYDANRPPVETFIELVDALNNDQISATDKLQLMSQLFGEEGARQVAALIGLVEGDLSGAIESLPESQILSQDDVDAAREFKQDWAQVKGYVEGVILDLGGPMLKGFAALSDAVESSGIIDVLTNIPTALNWITDPQGSWERLQGLAQDISEGLFGPEVTGNAEEDIENFGAVAAAVHGAVDEIVNYDESAAEAAEAAADLNAEIAEQTEELTGQAEALQESIDQTLALADAQMSTADANLEVRDATRDAQAAYEDYLALDPGAGEREQEEALDRVVRAAADVADATEEQARATLAARGASLSAVGALDLQNESLIRQAGQMEGPVRDAILGYIADLNGIPPETVAEIRAMLNEGDIAGAINRLNGASRTRDAYVKVQTDQQALANVEYALNNVARLREAQVRVRRVAEIIFGRATGDPYTARGQYLVGEQGPELVTLPMGSRIATAGQTNGATAVAARVTNNYVTINAPTGTRPADILNAQRRYERIQGPS